jgi:hypothetical protein
MELCDSRDGVFQPFIILAVLAAVVGGSIWLRSAGQRAVAIALLLLLAIPGVLYVLFFLLLLIIQP